MIDIVLGCLTLAVCVTFVTVVGRMNVHDQEAEDQEQIDYLTEWYHNRM